LFRIEFASSVFKNAKTDFGASGGCIPPSGPDAWNPEEFVGDVLKAIKE
jgi:hypothetical protein